MSKDEVGIPERHLPIAFIVLGLIGLAVFAIAGACHRPSKASERTLSAGDPEGGKQLLQAYGCGSCHVIPGVKNAVGTVGPPLTNFARRVYIAGEVPNTPAFLVRWITVPQAIEPGTAMPNLGVTEDQAVEMASYLYTLR